MIAPDNESTRRSAAKVIAAGGIIAFKTDTFYGLGADPLNRNAVQKIRTVKGREEAKPILLLISDQHEVDRFIKRTSQIFDRIAKAHWPGPLTLIGLARPELPNELTAGSGTIGVRLPGNQSVRDLVRICGGALTATSANPSGSPPARSANEVEKYFHNSIELIIDSGDVPVHEPSTVLDLSDEEPRMIREGIIKRDQLAI